METDLEQEEKDLCAEITGKICSIADKKAEERNVYFFKIISMLADFGSTHDMDNMII